jgi:hypothetical protein
MLKRRNEESVVDAENFDKSLRALHKRSPWRPFTVALVNGDRFQVDHPEALVVRGGVAVFVAADGQPTLFDHESVSQLASAQRRRRTQ